MGREVQEIITDWAEGVNTTLEPDALPSNASPRGWNSALTSAAGGKAAVQKRHGMEVVNATALTGTPAILGQVEFKRRSGADFTTYHLLVGDNGTLTRSTGTSYGTPFTSGTYVPAFAVANNLVFIVNGQENKKFNGTTVQAFGITEPATAPTIAQGAASAGTGTTAADYEGRVTFYNSATGAESSGGATSSTVSFASGKKVDWTNVPVSADSQVDTRRLWIRNRSTMSTFRLAGSIADNVTTTATTDNADSALITLGPDTEENDPPPTLTNVCFHRNRMFGVKASDPSTVVYSKPGLPEAFDPDFYEEVNKDDGKAITALYAVDDVLWICKQDAIYGLFGDDPNTWEIRPISQSLGVVAKTAIATTQGQVFFFSEQGPQVYVGGQFIPIGKTYIAETVSSDNIKFAQFSRTLVAVDAQRERVLFAVCEKAPEGEAATTRNTMMLPFNYRLGRWESNKWNPIDVCSFGVVEDSDSIPWVYLGDYKGRVWKFWSGTNDGIEEGTTASGTVTSAASTTLTDSAATFSTTGNGLAQLYVYARNSDGDVFRRRIGSNTATVLTLDTGLSWLVTPSAGWTYTIGGPDFQWDLYASHMGQGATFLKKRYRFCYVSARAEGVSPSVDIGLDVYRDLLDVTIKETEFTIYTEGAIWDEAIWDAADFLQTSASQARVRLGFTAMAHRIRFSNPEPDEPLTLLLVGINAELLSDKLG